MEMAAVVWVNARTVRMREGERLHLAGTSVIPQEEVGEAEVEEGFLTIWYRRGQRDRVRWVAVIVIIILNHGFCFVFCFRYWATE
jgi:hypothetical protein